MRGSSRGAAQAGASALESVLSSIDPAQLAEDLFAAGSSIDGSATLRRALGDPSREGDAKSQLAARLYGGKISDQATHVIASLASQRWASERDLTDSIEKFAVQSVIVGAERNGRLQNLEDELFRFERIVAGTPELRDALTNRQGDPGGKAQLVSRLLEGKAAPETVRLARQAVLAPRGRRLTAVLESYLQLAAERRQQLTAVVTSAVALSAQEQDRLARALQAVYDRPIQIQPVVDPEVVGGLKVTVGDEQIDGTIARKLEGARRHLGG